MKITDQNDKFIEGESTSDIYPKSIEVNATANEISGCGGGTTTGCKITAKDVTIQMSLDKSIISLRKEMAAGRYLKKVDIYYVNGGSRVSAGSYYRLALGTAFLTSIQETSDEGDSRLKVQLTFSAGQIGWALKPQKPDGSLDTEIPFGWDFTRNTTWSKF